MCESYMGGVLALKRADVVDFNAQSMLCLSSREALPMSLYSSSKTNLVHFLKCQDTGSSQSQHSSRKRLTHGCTRKCTIYAHGPLALTTIPDEMCMHDELMSESRAQHVHIAIVCHQRWQRMQGSVVTS